MKKIRVLLAEMSPGLREILKQSMAGEPDMEVVDEVGHGIELLVAVSQAHTDVVVLGLEGARFPGISTHLLAEYPHLRILGLTNDGHRAALCTLETKEVAIGEVSQEGLRALIRSAAQV